MTKTIAGGLVLSGALLACGAVLQLDSYRDCQGSECTDGGSTSDADVDGDSNVPNDKCTTVADCPASDPPYTLCTSGGQCRRVVDLAHGSSIHLCALLDDGAVMCWGINDKHQLGTGVASPYERQPKIVPNIPPMKSVGVGLTFSCALSKSGQVYCWGDGTAASSPTPAVVNLPVGRKAIVLSVGQGDACALLDDSSISCWGDNIYGVDGCSDPPGVCATQDGGTASTKPAYPSSPRQISNGKEGYLHIAVGVYQTCASVATGQVHCWGVGGHMGVNPNSPNCCDQGDLAPFNGGALQDLVSTEFYACRKDDVGEFDCWGTNTSCVYAQGGCEKNTVPIAAPIFDPGATIAAGWRHMCWISSKGSKGVICRGDARYSTLGDGTPGGFFVQDNTAVVGLTAPVIKLTSLRYINCALQTDGQVMCWGGFGEWLLGLASSANFPDGQSPNPIQQATRVDFGNP